MRDLRDAAGRDVVVKWKGHRIGSQDSCVLAPAVGGEWRLVVGRGLDVRTPGFCLPALRFNVALHSAQETVRPWASHVLSLRSPCTLLGVEIRGCAVPLKSCLTICRGYSSAWMQYWGIAWRPQAGISPSLVLGVGCCWRCWPL